MIRHQVQWKRDSRLQWFGINFTFITARDENWQRGSWLLTSWLFIATRREAEWRIIFRIMNTHSLGPSSCDRLIASQLRFILFLKIREFRAEIFVEADRQHVFEIVRENVRLRWPTFSCFTADCVYLLGWRLSYSPAPPQTTLLQSEKRFSSKVSSNEVRVCRKVIRDSVVLALFRLVLTHGTFIIDPNSRTRSTALCACEGEEKKKFAFEIPL